jgi:hypothetical protein
MTQELNLAQPELTLAKLHIGWRKQYLGSQRVKVLMAALKLIGGVVARCLAGVGDGNWEDWEAALGL